MALVHHELCFGCGRTNLFGVLLEVESTAPGSVAGRCFIKQDHQGSRRGEAHEGVIVAALSDAMSLACGDGARATGLELEFTGAAPVGTYLEVAAQAANAGDGTIHAEATARSEGEPVAHARGRYERS